MTLAEGLQGHTETWGLAMSTFLLAFAGSVELIVGFGLQPQTIFLTTKHTVCNRPTCF